MVLPVPVAYVSASVGLALVSSLVAFGRGKEHSRRELRKTLDEARDKVLEKVKSGEFDNEVFVMFCDITKDIEKTIEEKDEEAIEVLRNRIYQFFKEYNIDPFSLLDLARLFLKK